MKKENLKFPKNISLTLEDHDLIDLMTSKANRNVLGIKYQNELVSQALQCYYESVFLPKWKQLKAKEVQG